jgi:hypothetical protein
MATSKSFKELVQHHVKGDAKFADALLREDVDAMLSGDVETGKTILFLDSDTGGGVGVRFGKKP